MIKWAAGRPAVMWALATGLIIAGGVAFTRLPLATRTEIDTPTISVTASWYRAAPEMMEMYVTSVLEGAIQGVRGVRKISSTSSEGSARIQVELEPEVDATMSRLAILERMEAVRQGLPPEARQSLSVGRYIPDDLADSPLIELNVTGPMTPGELTRIAQDRVLPRLEALEGVSGASMRGTAINGVVISYNPLEMKQRNIDPAAISTAITTARIIAPLGVEQRGSTERSITLRDVPGSLGDLARLPITGLDGTIHMLGDLAAISPDEDSRGQFYRLNGKTAVTIWLYRQGGADAIKTAAAAREAIAEARTLLPKGVGLEIASDTSTDLKDQLQDLLIRSIIAFSAVAVVLLISLRSLRSAALVIGSAMVAVAGTALGLYLLEIPANMLTLAGLGMGIGVLVQNGLVVVERLRKVDDTADSRAGAASAISAAVLGATLTTLVVLFPFLFLQGNARAAFMPFAAAFSLALICSVFTALVLIPAVGRGGLSSRGWGPLGRWYDASIRFTLRWRALSMVFTAVLLGVLTWGFVKKVPRSNWGNWWGGQRETVSARVSFPRGSDPAQVENIMSELEQVALGRPGVALVRVDGNPSGGSMVVEFTPEGGRSASPWLIYDELTARAVMVGGTNSISVSPPEGQGYSNYSGSGGTISHRIKILGYSFEGVRQIALDLERRLSTIARVRDVNINAGSFWGAQRQVSISVVPDREALARVGTTAQQFVQAVNRATSSAGGGTTIEFDNEELTVSVRGRGANNRQLRQLIEADVPNSTRSPVTIGDVATVGEVEGLAEIQRENQQYVRVLTYDFRGPPRLSERTHKLFMSTIEVPGGYAVSDEGFSWQTDDSAKGLYLVLGIGVVLVLLAVALVFNSWWATAMVFLSILMSMGGVSAAFWSTKTAFTREAAVGVILVVGLAVNQAILMIDAALNARRRHGGRVTAADVVRSARDRSELIVLVTITTIASLIPMAWGSATDTMFGAIALATAGGTIGGVVVALWLLPPFLVGGLPRLRRRRGPPKPPGRIGRLLRRIPRPRFLRLPRLIASRVPRSQQEPQLGG